MNLQKARLADLLDEDSKPIPFNVAVIPFGSVESHNLHLPYGTDTFTVEHVAHQLCEYTNTSLQELKKPGRVVYLPTIPYGVENGLMGFPLTINVSMSSLEYIVRDIVESLNRHNIHRIIFLNGHDGNGLKPLLRDLDLEYSDTFFSLIDLIQVCKDVYSVLFEKPGEHADELETSVGLHLFPELVKLEDADTSPVLESRFDAVNKGWVQITKDFSIMSASSGIGDPSKSTEAKGKEWIKWIIQRLSPYFYQLAIEDTDELFPYKDRECTDG